MNPGARVEILIGGHQAVQFDRIDPVGACYVQPLGARQQGGRITGRQEALAQRNRGKRVSGIGSGDHGDAHPPHPATPEFAYAGNYD
ncbi:hypothetical protein MPRG_17530 [Mycobacterium paragordonae]|uniref:Uncharacterized protein n=1 Tax=Mycobacterium paragordonae TaxID=1389713 RepID=A0ABQ1C231_9MYCO|nr:hypothetical protein MPRG_17530 [Mycobacterium paragordonae]